VQIKGIEFEVQRADPRQIHVLLARRLAADTPVSR
jgi:Mg2+/Co2+ transporter CorC